ncbi:MAG: CoA-binding protein [bacterium]|nr:CoA-binding protein [bacterium]
MTGHRLDRMLNPRSIAVVGASQREGSAGHGMIHGLINAGFDGTIFPVNPRYRNVAGLVCHESLADLPQPVDLAMLGVNSTRLEGQLDDAIAMDAGGAVIFDTCYLDGERDRGLLNRLKAKARAADLPVCGGNGMGFINLSQRLPVTIFDASSKLRDDGNVAFITHSGTVFSEIGNNDFRYACNLIVSCGQEINGTMADYMDYALDMDSTRVIALFMEEARDPRDFMAALEKARRKDVPVVAMKVGRTRLAAEFARVHSDADTGNDMAYQAVFDHYGVMRVGSMDEMANLLALLSHERQLAPGGLGVVLDSGGEREMFTDLADDTGVPLAVITGETQARIRPHLHHALEPVNPLDAWGTAHNYEDDFEAYFLAMAHDPGVAMVTFCGDFQWNPTVERGYAKALVEAFGQTGKPVSAILNTPMSGLMTAGKDMSSHGIVVLCGTRESLLAIRHALSWRNRNLPSPPAALSPTPALDDELPAALGLARSQEGTHGSMMPTILLMIDPAFGPLVGLRCGESDQEAWALPGIDPGTAGTLIDRVYGTWFPGSQAFRLSVARLLSMFSVIAPNLAGDVTTLELGPILEEGDAMACAGFTWRNAEA